jgi:hypothetical protein
MELSRTNPSPEYISCLAGYQELHQGGKLFDGRSLSRFIHILDRLIKENDCKTLLDYGAGRGVLYGNNYGTLTDAIDKPLGEYWGVDVDQYEPGWPGYDELFDALPDFPNQGYDAVICVDVLEHIPETDLEWVVDEMLSIADKIVFLNIACFPALKTFPDGTNLHISVFEPDVWLKFLSEKSKQHESGIYVYFDAVENSHIVYKGFRIDNSHVTELSCDKNRA